jgi:uncharacterized Zn finger protein (UPF0148 family)
LEVIAKCESGNRNVNHNSALSGVHSTASGYLQILDSTWKAFGGREFASRAIGASREEQFIVGARVLAGQGITAWNPSRGCWGGKVNSTSAPKTAPKKTPVVSYANCTEVRNAGKAPIRPGDPGFQKKFDRDGDGIGCEVTTKTTTTTTAPKKTAPKVVKKTVTSAPKTIKKQSPPPTAHVAKKAAASYLIQRGDTLSEIAAAQHVKGGWKVLFAANRDTVRNPNLIYTGNHLRLG